MHDSFSGCRRGFLDEEAIGILWDTSLNPYFHGMCLHDRTDRKFKFLPTPKALIFASLPSSWVVFKFPFKETQFKYR